MSATSRTFETALASFVESNKSAMNAALECSHLAIEHFYAHGDTAYLQRFHDALTENWNRVAAFKTWMRDFCPVKMDKANKLSKSTERATEMWATEEAKAALLVAAKAEPFWTYAKDTEQVDFNFEVNLIGAFKAAIKRAKEGKHYTATSVAANMARIEQAERMVTALSAGTVAAILPTPEAPKAPSELVKSQLVGEVAA